MSVSFLKLNAQQKAAVSHTQGPLLILAGAGSGKTRTLCERMAYLISHNQIPADHILALTFTNKAAKEMSQRVAKALPRMAKPLVCTFHSLAVRFLRQHIHLLGYRPSFVIFDEHDQLMVLKEVLETHGEGLEAWQPKILLGALQQAKTRQENPATFLGRKSQTEHLLMEDLLHAYQESLQSMNAVDFEDLLILSLRLCRQYPESHAFFRRFRHIMVDEYQDTNRIQYDWLKAMCLDHSNLCVVGDDDQSIYRWRGAEAENMEAFKNDHPHARIISLEQNYRSTDVILEASGQVIANNSKRMEKKLHGEQGRGDLLVWLQGEDENDEIEKMLRHLQRQKNNRGAAYSDFAVLYRSNYQARRIEEGLREHRIPYRIVGGVRFYERKEIKDALAYLKLLNDPDDEISLYRLLNFPKRGIGQQSRHRLGTLAKIRQTTPGALLNQAEFLDGFPPEAKRSMLRLDDLLKHYRQRFSQEPLPEVFRQLLQELGFHRAVEKEHKNPQTAERAVTLVYELEREIDFFYQRKPQTTLKKYLDHVAFFTLENEEKTPTTNEITLMTVHSAKGLEFPFVYMPSVSDEDFPSKRAITQPGGEQEERRLFYVAMTRAQHLLVFSMAKIRRRYRETYPLNPSRFLKEISPTLFEGESPTGEINTQTIPSTKQSKARFMETLRKMKAEPQR